MDPGNRSHLPTDIDDIQDHFNNTLHRVSRCSSAEWVSDYNHNPSQLIGVPFSKVFDDDELSPVISQLITTSTCNHHTIPVMQQNDDWVFSSQEQFMSIPVKNEEDRDLKQHLDYTFAYDIQSMAVPFRRSNESIDNILTMKRKKSEGDFRENALYSLVSYDESSYSDTKRGQKKLSEHITKEEGGILNKTITYFDVLCCRGGKGNKHGGNIRYLKIVREKKQKYRSLSKKEKSGFALSIVRQVQSSGGRFLKFRNNSWTEIPDEIAQRKVSAALRE